MTTAQRPTTALQAYNDFDERGMRKFRWNMNVGREPWGFSLNAEVWNGRIAMLAFFWVLIQEAIVGKAKGEPAERGLGKLKRHITPCSGLRQFIPKWPLFSIISRQ